MEMTDLLKFDIREDNIATPSGQVYIYKVVPPNFSTMDEQEQERFHRNFESFMVSTKDMKFSITALDRAVDTTQSREYIESLRGDFKEYKQDILAAMSTVESARGNSMRGYYFVIKTNDSAERENFKGLLTATGINFKVALKQELIVLMRSFLLREFTDKSVYVYEAVK